MEDKLTKYFFFEQKSWKDRLLCNHYWIDTNIPDYFVFLNGKFRYRCNKCGKEKSFRTQPVNFLGK